MRVRTAIRIGAWAAAALAWERSDLGPDGTHPSETGRMKVARLLLDFFQTDQHARPWFAEP